MILSYEFNKPFVFEGKEYSKIEVDTDKITAGMLETVEFLIADLPKNPAYVPGMPSNMFQIRLLALLMQKPIEFVKALPGNAFMYFYSKITSFLVTPDSPIQDSEQEEQ